MCVSERRAERRCDALIELSEAITTSGGQKIGRRRRRRHRPGSLIRAAAPPETGGALNQAPPQREVAFSVSAAIVSNKLSQVTLNWSRGAVSSVCDIIRRRQLRPFCHVCPKAGLRFRDRLA